MRPLALSPFTAAPSAVDGAADPTAAAAQSLKITHVLRAPVGGLFRHVMDIAHGQIGRGHRVGLIVDSATGGKHADAVLAELEPHLALGLTRVAIPRELGLADVSALHLIAQRIRLLAPDVLHGHGAKGGALARLAWGAPDAIRVYTPHGGSLIYRPGTLKGAFYCALESLLSWRTDLFLFESSYVTELYRTKVGQPHALIRVVRNGVGDAEFAPVAAAADATDIICLGELRPIKAIDVLIAALAILKRDGRRVTATIAGEGPQESELKALAARLGVADRVHFIGYCPARTAFAKGRMLVIPSRAESLPYVVLEAAAAGMPIIATRVGGIPEIFGAQAVHLVAPDDAAALAGAIGAALDHPFEITQLAQQVRARMRSEFSVTATIAGGLAAYREALTLRKLRRKSDQNPIRRKHPTIHITNF